MAVCVCVCVGGGGGGTEHSVYLHELPVCKHIRMSCLVCI